MKSDRDIRGYRILLVEDDYYLAYDLMLELTAAGAYVLGPFPRMEDALQSVAIEKNIDGAILDVNLGSEKVFPVADALMDMGVPIVLCSGFDSSELPARFRSVPRCRKPLDVREVLAALEA